MERALVRRSPRSALPAPLRYQHLPEGAEVLNAFARAEHDRFQRIFGQVDRHPCLLAQPLIEASQQSTTPVSAIPRSMMSPASSGGHLPSVVLTMSTTVLTGSAIACRTSADPDGR